jgi:hypothetical protein
MPAQVVPVKQLAQMGVIYDSPKASLAPNAFTDARNVRFTDNAVRKMEGEVDLFTITDDIVHVAWWPNPNLAPSDGYYVVITDNGTNHIANVFKADGTSRTGIGTFARTGYWTHTLFSGGFAIIINNGVDKPHYILDNTNGTDPANLNAFSELPGWDSYNFEQVIQSSVYTSTSSNILDLGQEIDFSVLQVKVKKTNTDTDLTIAAGNPAGTGTLGGSDFVPGNLPASPTQGTGNVFNVYFDTNTSTHVLVLGDGIVTDDRIQVTVETRNPVTVTCGVIRSFGELLIAGDLTEKDGSTVVRRLAGVIRVSDRAVPGAVPNNWNPHAEGVNTAEEFTLAETDPVVDMVPLQGNLYIYTNKSISVLRITGNANKPVSVSPITSQYGAQTTDAVVEYDGRHIVVGSNDIYVFTGNPGNITSLADGRVRDEFFDSLSVTYEDRIFLLQNVAKDEIWLCYPTTSSTDGLCDRAYIWNYRLNNWTVRDLNNVRYGVVAPVRGAGSSDTYRPWGTTVVNPNRYFPVFGQNNASNHKLIAADISYQFSGSNYVSYVERKELPFEPEFNTEQLKSIAVLAEGDTAVLRIRAGSTNYSGKDISLTASDRLINAFTVQSDYKVDTRITGRFLNIRLDDGNASAAAANNKDWAVSSVQLELNPGGAK